MRIKGAAPMLQHYNKGAMMYSAIMVIGTLYGRGIYNNNGGGAGANPGAAPFFLHTHIRAKAQGADRLAGHLDRGRRDPEKLTNIPQMLTS